MPLPGPPPLAPQLEFLCRLEVTLDSDQRDGTRPRRAAAHHPDHRGTVSGQITGKILNLGADWQTVFEDGGAELDTRYALETEDGALIEVINYGFRNGPSEVIAALAKGETVDPKDYYMRTHARLESGHPKYEWLNKGCLWERGCVGPNRLWWTCSWFNETARFPAFIGKMEKAQLLHRRNLH